MAASDDFDRVRDFVTDAVLAARDHARNNGDPEFPGGNLAWSVCEDEAGVRAALARIEEEMRALRAATAERRVLASVEGRVTFASNVVVAMWAPDDDRAYFFRPWPGANVGQRVGVLVVPLPPSQPSDRAEDWGEAIDRAESAERSGK